jgi:8-oxo-dGTP diphosphatase
VDIRIHVAVGIIFNPDKDKVLITKRTVKQHLAGYWEFPGGKVEKNEDVVSALSRELYEELGIFVNSAKKFTTISYDYPDKKVLLDVWKIEDWHGEPSSRENQELNWIKIDNLKFYAFPEANKHIIQSLSLSRIYAISPESEKDYSHLLSVAEECFVSGIKLFQLRFKSRTNNNYADLVKKLGDLAKKNNAKLILNGTHLDVKRYNIDGIHLKSKELMNYENRPISGDYILGASCHNEKELIRAEKLNANYVFISPVLATTSHPEKNAIGWDRFFELSEKVELPVYALGGMTPADLNVAKKYNAYGVAMIGAIWNSNRAISEMLL